MVGCSKIVQWHSNWLPGFLEDILNTLLFCDLHACLGAVHHIIGSSWVMQSLGSHLDLQNQKVHFPGDPGTGRLQKHWATPFVKPWHSSVATGILGSLTCFASVPSTFLCCRAFIHLSIIPGGSLSMPDSVLKTLRRMHYYPCSQRA